ncbi:MAG TPA: hypothetical protein VGO67_12565 [Verrucomicrobiae bacterium]
MLISWWNHQAARLATSHEQWKEAIETLVAQLQKRADLMPHSLYMVRESIQVQIMYLEQIHDSIGTSVPGGELGVLSASAANPGPRPKLDVDQYGKYLEIKSKTEDDIAAARRMVAEGAANLNIAVNIFPTSLVAKTRGIKEVPMRHVTPELEIDPPIEPLPMLIASMTKAPLIREGGAGEK